MVHSRESIKRSFVIKRMPHLFQWKELWLREGISGDRIQQQTCRCVDCRQSIGLTLYVQQRQPQKLHMIRRAYKDTTVCALKRPSALPEKKKNKQKEPSIADR